MTAPNLPLASYTVLDLTIARAGPTAVRLLSDWGANVIRIEEPKKHEVLLTGRRRGPDEQNLHRNKRSIALDLKHPEGAAVLREMIAKADVVVESFRATVKKRLGLEYEQLKANNPRIILASISGYGQTGPYSDWPGVDQIMQGMSGLMSITGEPGRGPVRAGIAISDTTAGMFLGQGILLALLHRERTGEGQWVHTSLFESMLNKLDFQGARYTMKGEVAVQEGNFHPTAAAMGTFPAKDGLVNIAASSPKMFPAFCRALECPQLAANPDYADTADRLKNRRRLDEEMAAVTSRFTQQELIERLNPAGVPCGPIYDVGQAFEDPQARHLQMRKSARHPVLGEVSLVRSPINLSGFPHEGDFHHAAPDSGEQSDELLREFGVDEARLARLRAEGVVA